MTPFLSRDKSYHSASEPERVVREDRFGRSVVVLGGDTSDETFYVQLSRARLLARSVGTFQTSETNQRGDLKLNLLMSASAEISNLKDV